MASITSAGLGSGLDIEGLVTKLMTAEQAPITQIKTRESKETTKLSSWGQIKSALSSLQNAAQAMDTRSEFTTFKASIGTSTVATVSAGTSAVAGSYSLEVSKLAEVQKIKSAGYASASSTVVDVSGGSKTLSLAVGGTTTNITVDSTNNTLEGLRDAINKSGASVTATLVNDGDASAPYRLVITGKETGTSNAFSLTGLSELNYNASTGTGTGLTKVQAAQNAEFTVDGISISKASNTVTDAIQGVTLNLTATNSGSATKVTVTNDTAALQTKAAALVKAYNDLNSIIKVQTAYNATTGTAGTLNGDGTARNLQLQIRSILGGVSGSGSYSTLSSVGISFQKDGSMALDSSKLQKALDNPDVDVAAIFVKDSSGTGIASKLGSSIATMLGTGGMVTARTDGINATIKSMDKQIDTLTDRLTSIEKRYRAQFTALDTKVASLNSTSTFLTQQLAALSSSSS
ncbi:flagellar filament capping protein FliD [Uliginosibacterium paludis]|uniref:Flagellar hook-associated protein 2 n=1 Tax=Uliginosibacterium paludis TaxID=1615952 RepID=A0ABV2CK35_9RHOO